MTKIVKRRKSSSLIPLTIGFLLGFLFAFVFVALVGVYIYNSMTIAKIENMTDATILQGEEWNDIKNMSMSDIVTNYRNARLNGNGDISIESLEEIFKVNIPVEKMLGDNIDYDYINEVITRYTDESVTGIKNLPFSKVKDLVQNAMNNMTYAELLEAVEKFNLVQLDEKYKTIINNTVSDLGVLNSVKDISSTLERFTFAKIIGSEGNLLQLIPFTNKDKISNMADILNEYLIEIPLADYNLAETNIILGNDLLQYLEENPDATLKSLSEVEQFEDLTLGNLIYFSGQGNGILSIQKVKQTFIKNFDGTHDVFGNLTLAELINANIIKELPENLSTVDTLSDLKTNEYAQSYLLENYLTFAIGIMGDPYMYNINLLEIMQKITAGQAINIVADLKISDLQSLGFDFSIVPYSKLNKNARLSSFINFNIKDLLGNLTLSDLGLSLEGGLADLGEKTIGELIDSGIDIKEIIGDKPLGDLIGNFSGLLEVLNDKTINELTDPEFNMSTLFEGKTVGELIEGATGSTRPESGFVNILWETELNVDSITETIETTKLSDLIGLDTSNKIVSAIADSTIRTISDDINNLTLSDVMEIDSEATGILATLKDTKITELSGVIEELKLCDVIDIPNDATGVLNTLRNVKITELKDAIDNLTLGEVLDIPNDATGLLASLRNENLSTLPDAIDDLTLGDVFGVDNDNKLDVDGILKSIAPDTKINEIGTAVDNLTLGDIFGVDGEGKLDVDGMMKNLNPNTKVNEIGSAIDDLTLGDILGVDGEGKLDVDGFMSLVNPDVKVSELDSISVNLDTVTMAQLKEWGVITISDEDLATIGGTTTIQAIMEEYVELKNLGY